MYSSNRFASFPPSSWMSVCPSLNFLPHYCKLPSLIYTRLILWCATFFCLQKMYHFATRTRPCLIACSSAQTDAIKLAMIGGCTGGGGGGASHDTHTWLLPTSFLLRCTIRGWKKNSPLICSTLKISALLQLFINKFEQMRCVSLFIVEL